jgi:hypothetical protein
MSSNVISIRAAEPICDCDRGHQGRVPCPTPQACLLEEPEAPLPLFANTRLPSRLIALTLAAALGYVLWLLVTGK